MSQVYDWNQFCPNMSVDVRTYIARCEIRHQTKSSNINLRPPVQSVHRPLQVKSKAKNANWCFYWNGKNLTVEYNLCGKPNKICRFAQILKNIRHFCYFRHKPGSGNPIYEASYHLTNPRLTEDDDEWVSISEPRHKLYGF